MTYLLALDPGLQTGWCYGHYSETEPFTILREGAIQGGCEGFIGWWHGSVLNTLPALDEIVCELFVIDGTITGSWSPRIEGALMAMWDGPITWQTRADKAALLPTETARRAWFNRQGVRFRSPHALDAATHAVVLCKRRGHLPTIERYWPKPAA